MNKKLQQLKNEQDEIFNNFSKILLALAAPVRLKLIHFLSQAPLTVEVLATKTDQSVANTSMHLRKMLTENIVQVAVHGQKRLYSLNPALMDFWESCQNFAQAIDPKMVLDVNKVYGNMSWEQDIKTTLKMIKAHEVTLVDARPEDEVAEEIKGLEIFHISTRELVASSQQLPKRKPILVFCRGRFCALSAHVVDELRSLGFKAFRLEESWHILKKMS